MTNMSNWRILRGLSLIAIASIVLYGFLAFAASPLQQREWVTILTAVVLASSWSMAARAGLISLGHAAFYGLGAYSCLRVLEVTGGFPPLVAIVIALVTGAVVALLAGLFIGFVTVRMRGFYFAIATLGLAEALRFLAVMAAPLTGGSQGTFVRMESAVDRGMLTLVFVALTALTVAAAYIVHHSRLGFAFAALHQSERAATMLGVPSFEYRLIALLLSAAPSGALGAASAIYVGYIAPDTVFNLHLSVEAQVGAIAGGLNTVVGPILGGAALATLGESLRSAYGGGASLIMYGITLIIIIIFLPRGLISLPHVLSRRMSTTRYGRAAMESIGRRIAPLAARFHRTREPSTDAGSRFIPAGPAEVSEPASASEPPASPDPEAALEVIGLSAGYGQLQALRNVSVQVKQGSIVALIGANGAGKSTLLKSMVGLVTPTAGEVWINGRSATGMRPHDFVRRGVALIPEGRQVFPGMSVLSNLQLGAYRQSPGGQRKGVERALQTFPALANRTNQLAGSLSGGEQQMLAIGRALASDPQILLIDELSLGLSPVLVEELLKTLKEVSSQGVTVFVVEQDVETAIEVASHLYALEAGELVFSGAPEAIRSEQSARKLYLGL